MSEKQKLEAGINKDYDIFEHCENANLETMAAEGNTDTAALVLAFLAAGYDLLSHLNVEPKY